MDPNMEALVEEGVDFAIRLYLQDPSGYQVLVEELEKYSKGLVNEKKSVDHKISLSLSYSFKVLREFHRIFVWREREFHRVFVLRELSAVPSDARQPMEKTCDVRKRKREQELQRADKEFLRGLITHYLSNETCDPSHLNSNIGEEDREAPLRRMVTE